MVMKLKPTWVWKWSGRDLFQKKSRETGIFR